MYFDSSSSKEGAGAGIVLVSPSGEVLNARLSHHIQAYSKAHTQPSKTSTWEGTSNLVMYYIWLLFIHYKRGWSGCTLSNYSFVNISLTI